MLAGKNLKLENIRVFSWPLKLQRNADNADYRLRKSDIFLYNLTGRCKFI